MSSLFVGFCGFSVLVALVPLASSSVLRGQQGIQALNLDFFISMPKPVGEAGGGMANAIVGTLILIGLGSLFAIPSAFSAASTCRSTPAPGWRRSSASRPTR